MCSLLPSIVNSRALPPPSTAKIFVVWDVHGVLNFIESTWGEADILGGKELSLKFCMLLALTTSSRASGIHHLDIKFMVNSGDKLTFHFHKLHKSWRKGKPPSSITVYAHSPDKQLCVVQTLNRYLEMTKDKRDPSKTQLLLIYRKPYKEIASSTVSGWFKKVLKLANMDTYVFKGHSTRSASTSKVNLKGLALSDILHRGSWLRAWTWQKFYNNQIASPDEIFQYGLLKNNCYILYTREERPRT